MAYVAYLRVYEPLTAFHEPERSRWARYAASTVRPRRQDALRAEQAESLRRVIAGDGMPDRESEHAYVRRMAGTVYVCPWQVRLRCLVASGGTSVPMHPAVRPHIRSRAWSVPLPWFVPFGGEERWVAVGAGPRLCGPGGGSGGGPPASGGPGGGGPGGGPGGGEPGGGGPGGGAVRAAPQAGRALVYATTMSSARQRLAKGMVAVRSLRGSRGAPDPLAMEADLAELACWLERFHPSSLVELDYGGLVYLFSDEALFGDESVAEVAAALEGIVRDRREVAAGMLARVRARWRRFQAFEQVN
jgi:hypothetical protein